MQGAILLDWLSKIFSSIISLKTAAIASCTCIAFVFLWKVGIEFIETRGVPSDYSKPLFFICVYSSSHILIELLYKVGKFFNKTILRVKKSLVKYKETRKIKDKIKKSLPHLNKKQIGILDQLINSEKSYAIALPDIAFLEQQKYIFKFSKITSTNYLYKINSLVKKEAHIFIRQERKVLLKNFISNITQHEEEFLNLFFMDSVNVGTSQTEKMLDADIFVAGEGMSDKGVIIKFKTAGANQEKFELPIDTANLLKKVIFHKAHKRQTLSLDSNYVLAKIYTTGGGLTCT